MAELVIQHQADLTALSTFGLTARADCLITLRSLEDLEHLPSSPEPKLILGEGSNTVFLSNWPGTVLLNRLKGIQANVEGDTVELKVAAGESWHALVKLCIRQGWYGLENLIMIPGSVGAAPIQNIGAYGVELASCVQGVTAWDMTAGKFRHFDRSDCSFSYRDSLFKQTPASGLMITEVHFRLSRTFCPQTHYPSLQSALKSISSNLTPARLAATIMNLRRHRLPSPSRLANVGSFFKNPSVSATQHQGIKKEHPSLPSWPNAEAINQVNTFKLSAAWMIEQVGLKGHRIGDAAVYDQHALVLVNLGDASANQLEALIELIQTKVYDRFGVQLEPEPRLIRLSA